MSSPVFVYGTLRVGEALAGLLPEEPHRYSATARGYLHYAPGTKHYPVFIPSEDVDADDVDGEVVWLNLDDPDVAYVVIMELSTGYDARWMDVTVQGSAVTGSLKCLTFCWDDDNAGDYIPSADWSFRDQTMEQICGEVDDPDTGSERHWYCCECGEGYYSPGGALQCEIAHDEHDFNDALDRAIASDHA
jgi:gamma-glutamylcyclotransferase (GGCT)/AIG2-like uncharacterized protein YtfP